MYLQSIRIGTLYRILHRLWNILHISDTFTAAMKVVTVPVHEDNYAYLLIDEASKEALVVDPGVPSAYVLLNANLSYSLTCSIRLARIPQSRLVSIWRTHLPILASDLGY